ncbi:MAG TPA: PaaX family transcriptional regulator C-terminal domain-containing protein [Pseudonocardia sp.]|jgi:phenylacetic acid degradation operon negative regulatory protein
MVEDGWRGTPVEDVDGLPGVPRPTPAGSARSVLLTVLGELVHPHRAPVWTSSLLYVLKGLGLESQTARQAIVRGAAAGWLDGEKVGREVRWRLSDLAVQMIEDGSERVHSTIGPTAEWDGDWLILYVTISQQRKAARKKLYSALSWSGFGNPTAGVWVSPHPERAGEARRILGDLDLRDSTISFVGPTLSIGLAEDEIVRRAWDLEEVAGRYEELIERFADLTPESGDDTLFTHVSLVSQWQRFPFMDPQLPEELLPGWIGRTASELFWRQRKRWNDAAHARWLEVVRETAPVG